MFSWHPGRFQNCVEDARPRVAQSELYIISSANIITCSPEPRAEEQTPVCWRRLQSYTARSAHRGREVRVRFYNRSLIIGALPTSPCSPAHLPLNTSQTAAPVFQTPHKTFSEICSLDFYFPDLNAIFIPSQITL